MKTNTFKYFSGTREVQVNGAIMSNKEASVRFPGVKVKRYDSFSVMVGYTTDAMPLMEEILPITRVIRYNENGSKHECDSRCRNAKGSDCECSCGGRYHGADR